MVDNVRGRVKCTTGGSQTCWGSIDTMEGALHPPRPFSRPPSLFPHGNKGCFHMETRPPSRSPLADGMTYSYMYFVSTWKHGYTLQTVHTHTYIYKTSCHPPRPSPPSRILFPHGNTHQKTILTFFILPPCKATDILINYCRSCGIGFVGLRVATRPTPRGRRTRL